jgi:hypothetical protein
MGARGHRGRVVTKRVLRRLVAWQLSNHHLLSLALAVVVFNVAEAAAGCGTS